MVSAFLILSLILGLDANLPLFPYERTNHERDGFALRERGVCGCEEGRQSVRG